MQNTGHNRPLRIRAVLQTAIISDQFLPLDSVLYYHTVRDHMGEQTISKPGEGIVKKHGGFHLPIARIESGIRRGWYYACSFAQWPENTVEDKSFFTKKHRPTKYNLIDFQGKKETINVKSGRYKPIHSQVYYRHALHVDWYVNGDKEKLKDLLRFCTHLGKKSVQGWGSVLRWEVIDWPEDWSVRGRSGELMRAIPSEDRVGHRYGIRPSYWLPKHQFICEMPR